MITTEKKYENEFHSWTIVKNGTIIILCMILLTITSANCKKSGDADAELDWYASLLAGANFTDNGNATVFDKTTGLTLKKCSQGQVYNAQYYNCTGTGGGTTYGAVSMNFCEVLYDNFATECTNDSTLLADEGPAFDSCNGDTTAGFTDWRLPEQTELVVLAELVADRDTLALNFPQTPDDKYFWSANGEIGSTTGNDAYGVSFAASSFGNLELFHKKNSNLYVRCVRN